jgi:predicted small lipoprotein YifL
MRAGRFLLLTTVLAALAVTSACGRKAPLDTPYQAALEARREAAKNNEPLPPEPTPPVRDRRFILDGLID